KTAFKISANLVRPLADASSSDHPESTQKTLRGGTKSVGELGRPKVVMEGVLPEAPSSRLARKLVLNFALGKRDQATTNAFIEGLRLAASRSPYQLTADGFGTYPQAIENTLSDRVDFAQLIKVYRASPEGERKYSPAEVVST